MMMKMEKHPMIVSRHWRFSARREDLGSFSSYLLSCLPHIHHETELVVRVQNNRNKIMIMIIMIIMITIIIIIIIIPSH